MNRILTILLLAVLLAVPSTARAVVGLSVEDGGVEGAYRAYDFYADVTTEMGVIQLLIDTAPETWIFQNLIDDPDNPAVPFASYVTANSGAVGALPADTFIYGGAINLGGAALESFTTSLIDIAWSPEGDSLAGPGIYHVARVVVDKNQTISYQLRGMETDAPDPVMLSGIFGQLSLRYEEVGGGPVGKKVYDFYADGVTNNLAANAFQFVASTYHPDIYLDLNTGPNDPNDAFSTYVTAKTPAPPPGALPPASTSIDGGAVDLGGGSGETFSSSLLDIAWSPVAQAAGDYHVGRVVVDEHSILTYEMRAIQDGGYDPVTISGTLREPFALEWEEAVGAPTGYTSYDVFANVQTHIGVMQLLVTTTAPGDIYQNASSPADPDDAYDLDPFDTYVTTNKDALGENPDDTVIYGGAVNLGGAVEETFGDGQNIDIAWSREGGTQTGSGRFQIARITLKDGTTATWDVMGLQFDELGDPATLSGAIGPLRGDVNEDGFIDSTDLSIVIGNWGETGLGRPAGDLNRNGVVDGSDYTEVLSYWAPEPPEAAGVPEPAVLSLLFAAASASLLRRRRG